MTAEPTGSRPAVQPQSPPAVGRTPTHDELADAVRRDHLSVVRIRWT